MPLISDHPVHEKVKHEKPPAACYDRTRRTPLMYYTFTGQQVVNRFSDPLCRQIGRKVEGEWVPLLECEGCIAKKDVAYIAQARKAIDVEMTRFMKADQRIS